MSDSNFAERLARLEERADRCDDDNKAMEKRLHERIDGVEDDIDDEVSRVDKDLGIRIEKGVNQDQFRPVSLIAYGLAGTILTAVLLALLALLFGQGS